MEVSRHDEPWIVTVRVGSQDGSTLEVTWDEVGATVSARWLSGNGEPCLIIERESVSRVLVQQGEAGVFFEISTSTVDFGGELTLQAGSSVTVRDVLLRR